MESDVAKGLGLSRVRFVTSSGHAWLYMGTHMEHRWHTAEVATVTVSNI